MQITEIRIRAVNAGRVRARVSITINNSFVISGFQVVRRRNRYFVEYPKRKQPDGSYLSIVAPKDARVRKTLKERVLAEFQRATGDPVNKRS